MESVSRERLDDLARDWAGVYQNQKPFPYIFFTDFLNKRTADQMVEDFHPINKNFYRYDNPLEKKFAFDRVSELPDSIRNTLADLSSPPFLNFLEKLTGIDGLIPDPYYRGGGVHQSKRGGKLDIHIDFNNHPKLKLERRINVLVFLNKNWEEGYNGDFQIWDGYKDGETGKHVLTKLARKIYPTFNTFVCFNTSGRSYHGFPDEIRCPENVTRKSIALYYYTVSRESAVANKSEGAHSTTYVKRPHEDDSLEEMRSARNKGRLGSNIKDNNLS